MSRKAVAKMLIFAIILCLALVITVACRTNDQTTVPNEEIGIPDQPETPAVLEIRLPSGIFDSLDKDTILEQACLEGLEVTENVDNTVSFIVGEEQQQQLIAELSKELDASWLEIINSISLKSLRTVNISENYAEYQIIVDRKQFDRDFSGRLSLLRSGLDQALRYYLDYPYAINIDFYDEDGERFNNWSFSK